VRWLNGHFVAVGVGRERGGGQWAGVIAADGQGDRSAIARRRQRTPVAAVAFGGQVVGVATVVSPQSATAIAFTQRSA